MRVILTTLFGTLEGWLLEERLSGMPLRPWEVPHQTSSPPSTRRFLFSSFQLGFVRAGAVLAETLTAVLLLDTGDDTRPGPHARPEKRLGNKRAIVKACGWDRKDSSSSVAGHKSWVMCVCRACACSLSLPCKSLCPRAFQLSSTRRTQSPHEASRSPNATRTCAGAQSCSSAIIIRWHSRLAIYCRGGRQEQATTSSAASSYTHACIRVLAALRLELCGTAATRLLPVIPARSVAAKPCGFSMHSPCVDA